jgi:hypothetical protein
MDAITAKVSQLEISSHPYPKAFDRIVDYIHEIRRVPLSRDEIDVTRLFAGPCTSGGMLVILIEPLQGHPWNAGANAVITDCSTLSEQEE